MIGVVPLAMALIVLVTPPGAVAMPARVAAASAQAPLPVAAPSSAAERLVRTMFPPEILEDLAGKAFDGGVEIEILRHPDEHRFYANKPDLKARIWHPMRVATVETARRDFPRLYRDIAEFLDDELPPGEIETLALFYASPVGKKLLGIVFTTVGENAAGDPEVSRARVRQRTIAALTPEDLRAAEAMQLGDSLKHFADALPRARGIAMEWSDQLKKKVLRDLGDTVRKRLAEMRAAQGAQE